MGTVKNILKVISIQEISTNNGFIGKIVEFQEHYINSNQIKNGEIGVRILWDKKTNILIENLETGQLNYENWKSDPLFEEVEIGDLIEGKILSFINIENENFNCALLDNEPNELKKATQQYFYLTGKNELKDINNKVFKYNSTIKIIF